MRIFAFATALTLAVAPLAAQSGPDPSTDKAAILATINKLFATMRSRDTAAMRTLFEPGARLVGIRTHGDGTPYIQTISVDQWLSFNARDSTRGAWVERAYNPAVQIDRTLATVWADYTFYFDTRLTNCGTDAVQLLKLGDAWKIVSLADTYRTNCDERTGAPPTPRDNSGN